MDDKLTNYLNGVFAPYSGVRSVDELKADLLADLHERFRELKAEGKDEATAFEMTIGGIGDIEQTVREVANLSRSLEWQVAANFSASNLPESDFAGVVAHNGKFSASALRGSDFSGADLTGSTFKSSDAREANFDGANLTDCVFSTLDLGGASFNKSILVRTEFSKAGLAGARFAGVRLTDVQMKYTDLRETIFEGCTFTGVDFKYSDLRGLCLDGQAFVGVKFDGAALNDVSFKGATIRNASFRSLFAITNRYYLAIKTIRFDGAMMDKLTYAALKGLGADLARVELI
jgi:uncharacterized protein YjbI with pentapeptide repeats